MFTMNFGTPSTLMILFFVLYILFFQVLNLFPVGCKPPIAFLCGQETHDNDTLFDGGLITVFYYCQQVIIIPCNKTLN